MQLLAWKFLGLNLPNLRFLINFNLILSLFQRLQHFPAASLPRFYSWFPKYYKWVPSQTSRTGAAGKVRNSQTGKTRTHPWLGQAALPQNSHEKFQKGAQLPTSRCDSSFLMDFPGQVGMSKLGDSGNFACEIPIFSCQKWSTCSHGMQGGFHRLAGTP